MRYFENEKLFSNLSILLKFIYFKILTLIFKVIYFDLSSRAFDRRVVDHFNVPQQLMTLEAIRIAQQKPILITRDEYRSQELTFKY